MTTTTTDPRRVTGLRGLLAGREYDFVGQSRRWLYTSLVLLAICVLGVAIRGLNFGIDFTGGTAIVARGTSQEFTVDALREALAAEGVGEAVVQIAEDGEIRSALVRTEQIEVGGDQQTAVVDAIARVTGAPRDQIDVDAVGPRWGEQISRQALIGLAVFLALTVLYLSIRLEWRMAVAAIVTLLHDIAFTIGVYAIVGFEVTPASVIALLTILGYSLYDTVIVFDRVQENASRLTSVSTQSYGEVANHSLNQVLVRSISTSVTALLPVGSLLFVGANLLGADTLRDLALALFVGMAVGTYSSIFVATPLLVWLKEREPRYAQLRDRAAARSR